MREYTLRNDGLCNTITTVTKDNYIAVENKGYLDICINDKGKVNKKPQVTHGYFHCKFLQLELFLHVLDLY